MIVYTSFVGGTYVACVYLLSSVDVFVESFEGINVKLDEFSKQIKVAL